MHASYREVMVSMQGARIGTIAEQVAAGFLVSALQTRGRGEAMDKQLLNTLEDKRREIEVPAAIQLQAPGLGDLGFADQVNSINATDLGFKAAHPYGRGLGWLCGPTRLSTRLSAP